MSLVPSVLGNTRKTGGRLLYSKTEQTREQHNPCSSVLYLFNLVKQENCPKQGHSRKLISHGHKFKISLVGPATPVTSIEITNIKDECMNTENMVMLKWSWK
jgi:hypothetical protein